MNETSQDNLDPPKDLPNLSLFLGGPLYRLWRRIGLAGPTLQFPHRRIVLLVLLGWLPLLILSIAQGNAWGNNVKLPFLRGIEIHVRLFIAVPLMIMAELVVHQRMRNFVIEFIDRGIIPDSQREKFNQAIASAVRLSDSPVAEVLLIAFVYTVGVVVIWRSQVALELSTWYGTEVNEKLHLTLAGWWMACVSLPIFQFLLLRWYFRLFVWARLLWQVSRLDLKIMPAHPDRYGGLGFLTHISNAFQLLLLAQGAQAAGVIANWLFYGGMKLPQFEEEILGLVAIAVFAILAPLLAFSPKLAAAKRAGLRRYGLLAQRYVQQFDHKWLHGDAPPPEPLLGTADIQSLADMGNSYAVVKGMRWVLFSPRTVLELAIILLLPVAPLLLTMFPLEDLIERLLKMVF